MTMLSRFTLGGVTQCVYPQDAQQFSACGALPGTSQYGARVSATDLEPLGAILHARYYSNELISTCDPTGEQVNFDYGLGYNWVAPAWPYVADRCGAPWFVLLSGQLLRFCPSADQHAAWTPGGCDDCQIVSQEQANAGSRLRHKLFYHDQEDAFVLYEDSGAIWKFQGFCHGGQPGRFQRYQHHDETVQANGFTAYGHLQQLLFTVGGVLAGRYDYTYQVFGDNAERLTRATHYLRDETGTLQKVREADYVYYGEGETHGSLGDLKTVTVTDYSAAGADPGRTSYYRYVCLASGARRIKYALDPEAWERLSGDPRVSDPFTASDEIVADYADHAFEYHADGSVTAEYTAGGAQRITYSFEQGTAAAGYNNWRLRATETGSYAVTFSNFRGDVLLREVRESADAQDSAVEYYQYDDQGNLVLHATPAAVESYSYSASNLSVRLKSQEGLIHVYEYYTQTTTGSGGVGVHGLRQYDKIQEGSNGTPITLRQYEYTQHSVPVILESGSSSSSSSASAPLFTIYPLLRETVYRHEDATGALTTSYGYAWHPNSLQMEQRVTTLPAVPAAQGGSGNSATRTERFDTHGNLIWSRDERGFITYHEFEAVQQVVTKTIEDVDGTRLTLPSGWSTPAGGGQHLVTDYRYDLRGRQIQSLGPEHVVDLSGVATTVRTASWTVFKDADRETRAAQGYYVPATDSYVLVNPVSITLRDAAGTRSESIQATRASTAGALSAADSFPRSSYVRWSLSLIDRQGHTTASRQYHTLPASGDGVSGTHYDETTYGYDSQGRQNKVRSPGGTITRTVLDGFGRALRIYVGTDDSGATDDDPTGQGGGSSSSSSSSADPHNNMVLITAYTYACAGGCGGSSQLSETRQYVDAATSRATAYLYDWRQRQEYVVAEADDAGRVTYTRSYFDNLDRVTKIERYLEQYPSSDRLLARQESFFDDLGRIYETRRYAVHPNTGAVGNYLVGYRWYDAAGHVIKQQDEGQRSFIKTVFDGLGRAIRQYVGCDLDETTYGEADDVSGDTILEQTETTFDAAGNVLLVTSRQRRHDATGTGELTTLSGSQPQARVSYVASWYDAIGRQRAVANYGTNGDSALTRPSTVPARSDSVLVSTTEYDAAGQAYQTVDPAGREVRQVFDAAGRVTKTIQNYQDGVVDAAHPDQDVTVEMTYTADGQMATLTAKNPATGDQVTRYVYGTTLADSGVARSDLLRAEIYPDSDDVAEPLGNGGDGVYDRVEYRYNRQGERTEKKDQHGTVHALVFDGLGRLLHDCVTTLGAGVDGAVRRASTTYEVRGMPEKVTHYDNATVGSGSVVNEVVREYNDLGMLTKEFQEHEGAQDGSTLYVQYHFDTTASGGKFTKGLRPSSVRYPNGRLVHFTYGAADSTADALNRLDAIKDDSGGSPGAVLASYTYLGLDTIVIEDYQQPDVRLEYFFNSAYRGFDRFGRVVDHRWYDYGASADRDRFTYGYDRASNRTYRENTIASGKDEFYTYDAINRLKTFDRGDLNAGKTAISGTPAKEEDWGLDMTGNWTDFLQKTSGSTDLDQDRTHNPVNEITGITETVGTAWVDPVHDRAGNMTTVPKPSSLSTALTCTWDAWHRLVEVKQGAVVVGRYEYDGLGRRSKSHVDSQSPANPNGVDAYVHYFYNQGWQELESRVSASENTGPESLQPQYQYVWSRRYIDAPVLRDKNTDVDGLCDDERIYYLGDANFNITTLISTAGDAVERYVYSPYGVLTIYDATWANVRSASSYANAYTYTGRQLDTETGLYYYRARVYAAQLGRFASRDPVGYVDGPVLYAAYFAVRGLCDPTGLSCRIEWEADLEECNDQAIECNRRCMKKRPPWPLKKGSYAHVAYCEAKCQAAYMACTAVADAAYAACLVKENAKPVCVGACGVVLVVGGAAICCVDTPAPGPADCVGAPIAACGMLMLCPPDENEEPRDYP
mgnify:CR=1 FL=1